MAGLPKKYIKQYGISKAAWRAYRASKRRGGSSVSGRKKTMKRKTTSRKPARRRTITQSVRMGRRPSVRSLVSQKNIRTIIDGITIGGGTIGTTLLVQKTPWVKDRASWVKALIQAGGGSLGVAMFKDPTVKKLFMGSIVGAGISLLMPLMPEGFKLAGSGRELSADEMEELATMGAIMNTPMSGKLELSGGFNYPTNSMKKTLRRY